MGDMTGFMKVLCIILMIAFLFHGYHGNFLGMQFAIFFALVYIAVVLEGMRKGFNKKLKE